MRILIAHPADGTREIFHDLLSKHELFFTGRLKDSELLDIAQSRFDAIFLRSSNKINRAILESSQAKFIGVMGVGVDNVDLMAAAELGVVVVNSRRGNTQAALEHTLALIFSVTKNIHNSNSSMHEGRFEKDGFVNFELFGATLGIIGLGRIGSAVARVALAIGMKVIAHDPYLSKARISSAKTLGIELLEFEEVLSKSQVISFHVPLNHETFHMLDSKNIGFLQKGVYVINASRGGVIEERALKIALQESRIAGAAIDTHEFETLSLPRESILKGCKNVILTPHLGSATLNAKRRVAHDICKKFLYFARRGGVCKKRQK